MRQSLTISAVLALLVVGFSLVSGAAALEATPPPVLTPVSPLDGGAMPPLEGGAPYDSPLRPSLPPPGGWPNGVADELTIDVWYGSEQAFGEVGTSQPWLNVLGSVSGPRPVERLTYSLNGSPEEVLSVGPDKMRLFRTGDFNIELDHAAMQPWPLANLILITADDGQSVVQTSVTVTYRAGTVWPLPYTADWTQVAAIADAAQVVDGQWAIDDGVLETVFPGFDRLVAIGDPAWTDYEVTVPVIVHALNSGEWTGPSNGGGVGIIVRWPGHTRLDGEQPRLGWRHLGALGWYHWGPKGDAAFELRGERGRRLDSRSDLKVRLGRAYLFKMRVESIDGRANPATYSFKFWEAGETEPTGWTMQSVGRVGEPQSGSVVLVAHQSEVTFGNVTVLPLTEDGVQITVTAPPNGTVRVTPQKALYQSGEAVQFQAVPDPGYRFVGWSGDLFGADNPQTLVLSHDVVISAAFEPETYHTFISPAAAGKIGVLAYTSGDILTLAGDGRWIPLLQSAVGPLGRNSDVEAFAFLPDGSLLVSLGRKLTVLGLGVVMPADVLRLIPDATGGLNEGRLEWYLDGSDVGLTTGGESIDALAVAPDGRLLVSLSGAGRVDGRDGSTLVVADEDVLGFTASVLGEATMGVWDVVCDGSLVPGLAAEDVVGLSIDDARGALLLSLSNGFTVAGIKGTSRDVLSLDHCSADAAAELRWNSRSTGFVKLFDAIEFRP